MFVISVMSVEDVCAEQNRISNPGINRSATLRMKQGKNVNNKKRGQPPSPQTIDLISPVNQDFSQLNRIASEANFLFLNFPKPREE